MGQKITFIIAPAGCAFHHIPAISQSMKAMFVTEVYRGTCAEDLPKVIGTQPGHHAVFVNTSREALKLIYPNAEIIGYYDACRAAGVSPFHTGNGQLIAPLNHAASLAAGATAVPDSVREAAQINPRGTYGVLMEVARERAKQISKGFDASQDDLYTTDELPRAAIVYALKGNGVETMLGRKIYPWNKQTFKDDGPRANLIKAAALLVAEIERLDRANAAPSYVLCEFCHGLDGDHKTGCCRVAG